MAQSDQVYEHELPAADDPEVEARVQAWLRGRRAEQRPWRAIPVGLASVVVGVVLWGELNALMRFEMPWLLMAATAVILGILMGVPFRKAGDLFDRRWAVLAFVLGLLMAVAGDIYALLLLLAAEDPSADRLDAIAVFRLADLGPWLESRIPLDWLVAGLAAVGAAFGARPWVTEANARLDARLALYEEWRAEDEASDEEASREAAAGGS